MRGERKKPDVFLDTSALFAGIWSEAGGAWMILRLAEVGALQIRLGPQVMREVDAVIRRKAPRASGFLALLLDRCGVRVTDEPSASMRERSLALTNHPGDAQIVAEAWFAEVEYLVTLDKERFPANEVLRKAAPFLIGTPGDFLSWYRDRFQAASVPL